MISGLSIKQAMAASGEGRTKLYEEIASGRLKARKAGKRTIILSSDLEEYLQNLPHLIPSSTKQVPQTPQADSVPGRRS
jgi:hypothetical protein